MKKRLISMLLAVVLMVTAIIPTYGFAPASCSIPIINISGDSVPIVDSEGNEVFKISNIKGLLNNLRQDDESLLDAGVRILMDILKTYYIGCFTQNFEPYYEVIYNDLEPAMRKARLDCNGNAQYGTDIIAIRREETEYSRHCSRWYNTESYHFYYDWRLDPLEIADELNAYIKDVKAATGKEKVGLLGRCLGTNVVLAYVAKYGMDDIQGVAFDGTVVNGAELLSEPVSGDFVLDVNGIVRLLKDLNASGKMNVSSDIIDIIQAAQDSGIINIIKFIVKFPNYNRIKDGIISSAALATFYTMPGYWGAVTADDYQDALTTVFGPEGSELRKEYAGLIEKLDNYDVTVRQRIPELMKEINDNGNLAIISKYGCQLAPIAESRDLVGDQVASVKLTSFGATTTTIFETFSDEYIENAKANGTYKYISPDRQIDASTCMFPDQTFFIKGASHSDWTEWENEVCSKVICADHQLTIDDLPEYQYMIYDYETAQHSKMTTENCHTENWTADISEKSFNPIRNAKGTVKLIKLIFNLAHKDN